MLEGGGEPKTIDMIDQVSYPVGQSDSQKPLHRFLGDVDAILYLSSVPLCIYHRYRLFMSLHFFGGGAKYVGNLPFLPLQSLSLQVPKVERCTASNWRSRDRQHHSCRIGLRPPTLVLLRDQTLETTGRACTPLHPLLAAPPFIFCCWHTRQTFPLFPRD